MGLNNLAITLAGAAAPSLTERWVALALVDGIGYEADHATLTLSVSRTESIVLPPLGRRISYAVSRGGAVPESLGGALHVIAIGGDTRAGTVTIDARALPPETPMRQQRDAAWSGQTIGAIARVMAERAGLVPVVSDRLADTIPAGALQDGESDQQFMRRLTAPHGGRVVVKDGRLIVLASGERVSAGTARALPAVEIDLAKTGAWIRWRRSDTHTAGTVIARYRAEDGATISRVSVGSGIPRRTLSPIYSSIGAATAAAEQQRRAADASRDWIEIQTALLPSAAPLYPLTVHGAPSGFSRRLTIQQVRHNVGRAAASTIITARPDGGV